MYRVWGSGTRETRDSRWTRTPFRPRETQWVNWGSVSLRDRDRSLDQGKQDPWTNSTEHPSRTRRTTGEDVEGPPSRPGPSLTNAQDVPGVPDSSSSTILLDGDDEAIGPFYVIDDEGRLGSGHPPTPLVTDTSHPYVLTKSLKTHYFTKFFSYFWSCLCRYSSWVETVWSHKTSLTKSMCVRACVCELTRVREFIL